MTHRLVYSVVVMWLLTGSAGVSQRGGEEASSPTQTLYVARRGWHVDIGFEVSELAGLTRVAAEFPGARYVFFGFGDRHYLLARNKNIPVLLAALWPGAGLVLATSIDNTPEEAFGAANVIALRVTTSQAQKARDFVWNSLARANGITESYAKGPYEGSLYYTSIRTYSAIHTCNTWAAEALREARLPVHTAGVVFAQQLWTQLRRIEAAGKHPPPLSGAASTISAARLITGRLTPVLAYHRRFATIRGNDYRRGFRRRWRIVAADAALQNRNKDQDACKDLHGCFLKYK